MKRMLLTLGVAGLYTWAVAWQHVQATRVGYRVAHAADFRSKSMERIAYLKGVLADKAAPTEIARRAEARLGMKPPDLSSLLVVRVP